MNSSNNPSFVLTRGSFFIRYVVVSVLLLVSNVNLLHAHTISKLDTLPEDYALMLPDLSILKSGFDRGLDAKAQNFFRKETIWKEGKVIGFTFIGKVITSEQIITALKLKGKADRYTHLPDKELKNADYPWKDDHPNILRTINIYADEFILKSNLWLPETNVTINARQIDFDRFVLNTSAAPWRRAYLYDEISDDKQKGVDGSDGGNISLHAEKIMRHPNNKIALQSNGSKGCAVLVPSMTINWPKEIPAEKELYSKYPCEGLQTGRSKKTYFPTKQRNIGLLLWDINWLNNFDCSKTWQVDQSIKITIKKNYIPDLNNIKETPDKDLSKYYTIKDQKPESRLQYQIIPPGSGGSAGAVAIFSPTLSSDLTDKNLLSDGGLNGDYIVRNSSKEVSYGKDTTTKVFKPKDLSFKKRDYCVVNYLISSGPLITRSFNYGSACHKLSIEQKFINEVQQKLTLPNATTTKGKSSTPDRNRQNYSPAIDYSSAYLDFLNAKFFSYALLSSKEQKMLLSEQEICLQALEKILNDPSQQLSVNRKIKLQSQVERAKVLQYAPYKNIDVFNHLPGFRPMLSLQSIAEYLDKSLDKDLAQFIRADILANHQSLAQVQIGATTELINAQRKEAQELTKQLKKYNKTFDDLQQKALTCSILTDTLKQKLKTEQKKLFDKLRDDAEQRALLIGLFNTAATACAVIPYGQPMLGDIGGKGLSAIAKSITGKEGLVGGMTRIFDEIDISSALDKYYEEAELTNLQNTAETAKIALLQAKTYGDEEVEVFTTEKTLKEYLDKVEETKAKRIKVVDQVNGIFKSWRNSSVSMEQINKELAEQLSFSYDLMVLGEKIDQQVKLKEEIFSKLKNNIAKVLETNQQLSTVRNNISNLYLLQLDREAFFNENLQSELYHLSDEALNRIKWAEYQLIKAYEYTSLTPFAGTIPSNSIIKDLYPAAVQEQQLYTTKNWNQIEQKIRTVSKNLKLAFDNLSLEVRNKIVSTSRNDFYQDDTGESIYLTQKSTLRQLNNGQEVIIDFFADFDDMIIEPDKDQIRILDITLDAIELAQPLKEREKIDIKMVLDDQSVLRNFDQFYVFHTEQPEGDFQSNSDFWSWTIEGKNNQNKILNKSKPSERYQNLINFMTKGTSSGRAHHSFALPPAMSKAKIKVKFKGSDVLQRPIIKKLVFRVKRDYRSIENVKKKMLHIKLDPKVVAAGLAVNLQNQQRVLDHHYCQLIDKNEKISLSFKRIPQGYHFSHWDMNPLLVSRDDLFKEALSFQLTQDVRVKPVFKKGRKLLQSTNTSPKLIEIYERPDTKAEIIARVASAQDYTLLPEKTEDGFQAIIYGYTKAYIKK